jgi:AraC-like DNA-binding protein
MVSVRCKWVVTNELEKLGLHHVKVELGEVDLFENITDKQLQYFKIALLKSGLELMDDKKSVLIEKIKVTIVELTYNSGAPLPIKLSAYLSEQLHHDYSYLSTLFSQMQGISIDRYFITHKIERVKELLAYKRLTLTEIANRMNYSSVAHLSMQFKKITGLTVSHFKQLKNNEGLPQKMN